MKTPTVEEARDRLNDAIFNGDGTYPHRTKPAIDQLIAAVRLEERAKMLALAEKWMGIPASKATTEFLGGRIQQSFICGQELEQLARRAIIELTTNPHTAEQLDAALDAYTEAVIDGQHKETT